ncbi:MAG: dethiobiotin synthase [Breznakibacter sp.]
MNLFISGIDTDSGKTMVTGLLARTLRQKGTETITAKLVQTGCLGISADIVVHRQLMGIDLLPEDHAGHTCPYVFGFPASPHLSARMENISIDSSVLDRTLNALEQKFPVVLTEGAGGIMVPLTPDLLTVDYVVERDMPVVLVTSGKLGSINHTLLSLEVCKSRKANVIGVIFNRFPKAPEVISAESIAYIKSYLYKLFEGASWDELPVLGEGTDPGTETLFGNLATKLGLAY